MAQRFTRREMLAASALGAAWSLAGRAAADPLADFGPQRRFVKEAAFYKPLDNLRVQCLLCPKECRVADRERGFCGVRENRGGVYYTLVHSRPCSIGAADPIEKKPLFHYLPGTNAFSIATAGCNMECQFCQNWQISQFRPEQVRSRYLPPREVVRLARAQAAPTIAFTYSEPTIFFEYMYDTAKAARAQGVGGVMISSGFINGPPMRKLCEQLTAVKIDLKAFTERFYANVCAGHLQPVLDTLKTLKDTGIWFEIVVLVIPTLNDSRKELADMCQWVREELGPDRPIHFSRFYPTYRLRNLPPTPVETLTMARDIAMKAGLHYAYVGNVAGHPGEHTYCPRCRAVVIRRTGYATRLVGLWDGKCARCGQPIAGVWTQEQALHWRERLKAKG